MRQFKTAKWVLLGSLILVVVFVAGCSSKTATVPNAVGMAQSKVKSETIMLPGDVPLDMVWIPPGTFMMGRYPNDWAGGGPFTEYFDYESEKPLHKVTLSSGFWMGKYEVTQAQWRAVMETAPWLGQPYVLHDPNSPVVNISWNDAQAFISALNTLTGKTFRLPSEAEWEYACRAGTTTRYYWGDDPNDTVGNDYAWWRWSYACPTNERYAHVAGQKRPNTFGLYDMIGNVSEPCEDDWHDSYAGAPGDGSAWVRTPRDTLHVERGGAWDYIVLYCRSAGRVGCNESLKNSVSGFRLAK